MDIIFLLSHAFKESQPTAIAGKDSRERKSRARFSKVPKSHLWNCVYSSTQPTWLSLSRLTESRNFFIHVVHLCFPLGTSHATNYSLCSESCLLSPPVSPLHAFLCRPSFTLFDYIGRRNSAHFLLLITQISDGGATSCRTIMAFLSSRLHSGLMIACSCRRGSFNGQYFYTPFPSSILRKFGHDINLLELLTYLSWSNF